MRESQRGRERERETEREREIERERGKENQRVDQKLSRVRKKKRKCYSGEDTLSLHDALPI